MENDKNEENKQNENHYTKLEDNNSVNDYKEEHDSLNYDSISKNPSEKNEKKFNKIFFQLYVKKFKTLEYVFLYFTFSLLFLGKY